MYHNYSSIAWLYFIISLAVAIFVIFKTNLYGYTTRKRIVSVLISTVILGIHCYLVYRVLYWLAYDPSELIFIGIELITLTGTGFLNVGNLRVFIDLMIERAKRKNKKR